MLHLDVYTLQLTASLIVLASVLCLFALWRSEQKPAGVGAWMLGMTLIAPGFLMLGFREHLAPILSIVASNAAIMAGLLFLHHGFREFVGKKPVTRAECLIFAGFLLPQVLLTYALPNQTLRIIVISAFVMSVCVMVCRLLLSDKHASWRTAGLSVAAVIGVLGVAMFIRMVYVMINFNEYAPQTANDSGAFFLAVIFIVGALNLTLTFLSYSALSSEYRLFASAVYQSSSSIIITDWQGRVKYANPGFRRKSGRDLSKLLTDDQPYEFGEMSESQLEDLWRTVEAGQTWRGELLTPNGDGSSRWEMTTVSPIKQKGGRISHLVAVQEDISALKEAENKIRQMAYHDALTGLPSLRLAKDRLAEACTLAKRNDHLAAAMFIDLDGFKAVNDTYGHDAGDKLLVDVANRMQACVRESDTVARIGGDEFLIVLQGLSGREGVNRVAEKVIEAVSKPIELDGDHVVNVGASIGIAYYPTHGSEPEEVLKHADHAMYEVKRAGKNSYQTAA